MATPTALTLAALRRSGYLADVAERWLPHANVRRDLFGIGDVVGIDRRQPGLLLVQCTTRAHVADRLAKAKGRPELAAWLKAGGRFEVWGWYRRAGRWEVRIVAVTGADLSDVALTGPARRRGRRPRQPELFG
jgi:hypothetical protein